MIANLARSCRAPLRPRPPRSLALALEALALAALCGFAVVAAGCCGAGSVAAGGTPRCRGPRAALNAQRRPRRTVVLISLDGFRHDYAARAGDKPGGAPAFSRMERQGARALRLVPPFPTQTFASHATLATGVRPALHGILNNRFIDRRRGRYEMHDDVSWYLRAPLWAHVQRLGLRAHVYHWPSSGGDWHGVEPAFWRRFNHAVPDDDKVLVITDWLARRPRYRPALIMSYFRACDRAGHDHGPDSPQVAACVRATDRRIARVMRAVAAAGATLVVVSDHGMTKTLGVLNAQRAVAQAGVHARVLSAGSLAHLYLDKGEKRARARAALAKLPHLDVYAPDDAAVARYRNARRSGDLVLVARPGYRFGGHVPKTVSGPTGGGHHGHVPSFRDMSGVLYLWGNGVRTGARLARARARDVVPTICSLLGVRPPRGVEGRVLREVLK